MGYLRVTDVPSDSWRQILISVLSDPGIFNKTVRPKDGTQNPALIERVGVLLCAGLIQPYSESINRLAECVRLQWEQANKESLAPVIAQLCSWYPAQQAIWQLMLTPREGQLTAEHGP